MESKVQPITVIHNHIETICDVVHPNAYNLPPEEFTLLRRQGLGASDAAAILGAMDKWKTIDDVISEKTHYELTTDEKEVAHKANVRRGTDLEPLVLEKTQLAFPDCTIIKPTAMYRIKEFPYLTVNFDGVMQHESNIIPVEAKTISIYGAKFWDFNKSDYQIDYEVHKIPEFKTPILDGLSLEDKAKSIGIPANYFVQVQQQLLGLNANYGYLAALNDKDWTVYIFFIPRDAETQQQIIVEGGKTSVRLKRLLQHSAHPWPID